MGETYTYENSMKVKKQLIMRRERKGETCVGVCVK